MFSELFKKLPEQKALRQTTKEEERLRSVQSQIPDGLFTKCEACQEITDSEDVISNYYICPSCGHYLRIAPRTRLSMVLDADSFEEWDTGLPVNDPLEFPGYSSKLAARRLATGLDEAVLTGAGTIQEVKTAIGVMSSEFLMGSMGEIVGEKIARMVERATKERLPVVLFCCSGGARMQEGMISLMQMAKTAQALKRHHEAGLFYVPVLTDPTTGGVTASFAMLGDVILAEPGALIGFAGPRVIEQTIGQKLPEGFQSAEFLEEHGFVDKIVKRSRLKQTLLFLLKSSEKTSEKPVGRPAEDMAEDTISEERTELKEGGAGAWERVRLARNVARPTSLDYIRLLFGRFLELHGDRAFGDDGAIVGGVAEFCGRYVTVIGEQKGRSLKENKKRNFGMPRPEGYRKALRLMRQAEKFGRPIICFVDTPGAFCGMEAEERGQGEAIARCLYEMSDFTVPVYTAVLGEGGSGGALALAVANRVTMFENSTYSILSPEGFASILWKDSKRAEEAAEVMKITAPELYRLGIIDEIISEKPEEVPPLFPEEVKPEVFKSESIKPEPAGKTGKTEQGVTTETMQDAAERLKASILRFLEQYERMTPEEIKTQRYERFRKF